MNARYCNGTRLLKPVEYQEAGLHLSVDRSSSRLATHIVMYMLYMPGIWCLCGHGGISLHRERCHLTILYHLCCDDLLYHLRRSCVMVLKVPCVRTVQVHACIYTCVFMREYVRIHMYMYIYIYIYTHTHVYIHIYRHIHILIYYYIHVYTYTYNHTYMCICICMCICMYVYIYIHTHTTCVFYSHCIHMDINTCVCIH